MLKIVQCSWSFDQCLFLSVSKPSNLDETGNIDIKITFANNMLVKLVTLFLVHQ